MPIASNDGGRVGKGDQVRNRLAELIESLQVGDAIPPERQLAESLGVSRPTLRAVVDGLVRDGVLRRRQGSGTYVAEPKVPGPLTMTSFSEDMRRRGLEPGSRLLSFEKQNAGAKLGAKLRVSPADEVWSARRLRLADGESMAIESLYFPGDLLPEVSRADLENGSFYELLKERGVAIAAGSQTIEATVTTEEEAELLGVPVYAPALLFERLTVAADGRPIEFVRSVYRGDRYQLVTELTPSKSSPLGLRSLG
ncbi:MAG: GntR family transcriptional regulator [Solirubrobacterales bacterium]